MKSMKGQYGAKKAKQVFYAMKNEGKLSGVDKEKAKKKVAKKKVVKKKATPKKRTKKK